MFNSARLTYRELEKKDFDFYFALNSNREVMKYAYLDAFENLAKAKEAFEKVLLMQKNDSEGTMYVAELKDTHAAIGIVDYEVLLKNPFGGIYEIGYFLQPNYWGKGYAPEMGKALIEHLFKNDAVHKIVASCHERNSASEAVMKKLGMSKEGVFKLARYKNGRWVSEIKYGILKEEWSEHYEINNVSGGCICRRSI